MSTYYYIGCALCKQKMPFISRTGRNVWMDGAIEKVPDFVLDHTEGYSDGEHRIEVFSEHDHRSDDYINATSKADDDEYRAQPRNRA